MIVSSDELDDVIGASMARSDQAAVFWRPPFWALVP